MTTTHPDDIIVEHDPAAHQFLARLNGTRAVLEYRRAPGKIYFVHTEVPAAFQHRGIADALAHAGLEYARTEHLAVIVLCPFVASYIRHHPEYQPLTETGA
jgi:predicted GNAT family acetyltransferase